MVEEHRRGAATRHLLVLVQGFRGTTLQGEGGGIDRAHACGFGLQGRGGVETVCSVVFQALLRVHVIQSSVCAWHLGGGSCLV